jgi:GDP-L-fucose synthase
VLGRHGISGEALAVWGTGRPKREFLYSEDLAEACLFVMREVDFDDVRGEGPEIRNTHLNIGTGVEVSIRQLAEKIREVVGFEGEIAFDTNMPDGTPRKLTDVGKLHRLGWRHRIDLDEGLRLVYAQYLGRAQDPDAP